MEISVKKFWSDILMFLGSSCPLWFVVLFFLGIIIFPSNTLNNQKIFDFFMTVFSILVGGLTTYYVTYLLKNKEQKNLFLNTGLAILRTVTSQTNQLLTLQKDFEERLALLNKFDPSKPIERRDLIKIVQNIRGETLINLDVPKLYIFTVDRKMLNIYEDSLSKLGAWAHIYRTIMEIILEINAYKKVCLKTDDPSKVDQRDVLDYMHALGQYRLPELIPQIIDAFNTSIECYNNFQLTLRRIFGDIPELMGQYVGVKEVYPKQ